MLPKFDKPTFTMTVPSTGKEVTFRPFLVKEEKILLIAQQTDDDKDMIKAISQILNNCIITEGFDVKALSTFDLEYMFLKLRSKSVNNIITLEYMDNDDGQTYKFDVDLDEIEIVKNPAHSNIIKVNDTVGIQMKYPAVSIADTIPEDATALETIDYLVIACIDKIFDAETIFNASEYSREELQTFIDELDVTSYSKIRDFFDTMPKMYKKLEYTNKNGLEREIVLNSLRDFFSWG